VSFLDIVPGCDANRWSVRNTPLLKMKIAGQYLPIATCSSLVDAVFSQEFEYVLPLPFRSDG